MKRGTPDHPKMLELAAKLDVERYAVVGIMELLWHFAGRYAPRGDIGRFSDRAIAEAVGWRKDPKILVRALAGTGWLDETAECRLVVHDWPEHADDYVHAVVARRREWFAGGIKPRLRGVSSGERQQLEAFYHSVSCGSATESATYKDVADPPINDPPATVQKVEALPSLASPCLAIASAAAGPPRDDDAEFLAWTRQAMLDYADHFAISLGTPDADICRKVMALAPQESLLHAFRGMAEARKVPAKSWAFFPTVLPQFLPGTR